MLISTALKVYFRHQFNDLGVLRVTFVYFRYIKFVLNLIGLLKVHIYERSGKCNFSTTGHWKNFEIGIIKFNVGNM